MSDIETRLSDAGLELPELSAPAAAYVPTRTVGNIVTVSGQLPFKEGELFKTGHLGNDVTIEEGQAAAAICAINALSHLKNACDGDLTKVKSVVKLEILVAATPDFTDAHIVANGASSAVVTAFGDEIGAHARVAYGVAVLPLGAAVEVAATFEVG